MTPKAKALKGALVGVDLNRPSATTATFCGHAVKRTLNGRNVEDLARTILAKLGISEDHVDELKFAASDSVACSRPGTAEATLHVADALAAILELAGEADGN